MSDKAEKPAKCDPHEELRRLKQHRMLLQSEMERLGEGFNALSVALRNPQEFALDIDQERLTIARLPMHRIFGRLERADFDFDAICMLLADHVSTSNKIAEAEPDYGDVIER